MAKDRLEEILERQFYGFLNLAFRNPWIFTGKRRPRRWKERVSQINSFLRHLGLSRRFCYGVPMYYSIEGKFKCNTEPARELCALPDILMDMLGEKSLKKMAETGDKNVKLELLEILHWSRTPRGCRAHHLQLSLKLYRKRVVRALRTLCDLKLATKEYKRYYITDLGESISKEIEYHLHDWTAQKDLLFHLIEVYSK